MWGYASSVLLSHKSYAQKTVQKNGPSVRCMISSTGNNRNDTKYAIYEVSQKNSSETRCEMKYTRHKVQDFYQVLIWSEILDLGSMIPKQIQQCINPTFHLLVRAMAVLHFSHRHGQSHPTYQVPHHHHWTWATNVNHMISKDLWCVWRLSFDPSILTKPRVCLVPVFSVPVWMSYRSYRSVRYRCWCR